MRRPLAEIPRPSMLDFWLTNGSRNYLLKICSVIGARPQFVKAGAVCRATIKEPRIEEILVHTGQHYDFNMSEVFFQECGIPSPKYNLGVGSGAHAEQTARMLEGLAEVFVAEAPDVVLVYGDTNSTLAGAIAAAKLRLPIAHVEAGLRSFNRNMPEEINRIVADSVSDILFAPTDQAVAQLLREGHPRDRVIWSGDVMYDAAMMAADLARKKSTILDDFGLSEKGYFLATVHRAENTDDAELLKSIVESLSTISAVHPVVLPLHPRTREALTRERLLEALPASLKLVDPVGFVDMVRLEMGALAIVSDSGGVQKEAFFYRVPCFILRNETEWVELVDAGWNTLVPPGDVERMVATILDRTRRSPVDITPYGSGDAADVIVGHLLERYGD